MTLAEFLIASPVVTVVSVLLGIGLMALGALGGVDA